MKRILHGVSGHVKAGEVVAVMGPSGSGKTSLIHVLGGRRETGVTGTFIINGKTHQNTRSLLQDLGYVTQEDVLMTTSPLGRRWLTLPVCGLRRASWTSRPRAAAITAIVDRAIDEFDLERAANSPVGVVGQGGISGGEKRRLVIVMECVHKPKILLLDEPTSGLDATTALLVVNKLRSIANGEMGGHRAAVVTSIHQPRSSIMPLFDSAVLLADGREVYCGPTFTALPGGALSEDGIMGWLKDVGYPCPPFESPPDFMMDMINTRVEDEDAPREKNAANAAHDAAEGGGQSQIHDRSVVVKELTASWLTSPRRATYLRAGDDIASMDPSRAFGQSNFRRRRIRHVVHAIRRAVQSTYVYKLREPSAVATQAVNSVLMPLIIGSIFFDLPLTVSGANDRLSAISLIVLMQSFAALDQLLLFPKERGLFLHESNGACTRQACITGRGRSWSRSPLFLCGGVRVCLVRDVRAR